MKRNAKDLLLNSIVVLLTVAAAFTLVQRARSRDSGSATTAFKPVVIDDWRAYSASGERIGPRAAAVTITVFSDYQCPYCRVADRELQLIQAHFPDAVALNYRQFPLPFHEHAMRAARAAICGGRQGEFASIHRLIFQRQDSIGKMSWNDLAFDAGVPNVRAFSVCMDDTATVAEISRDTLAASRLGVTGTPTILINELKFIGNPGRDTLEKYISEAVRKSKTPRGA